MKAALLAMCGVLGLLFLAFIFNLVIGCVFGVVGGSLFYFIFEVLFGLELATFWMYIVVGCVVGTIIAFIK